MMRDTMLIKYVGPIGDGVVIIDRTTGREHGTRDDDTGEMLGVRPGETVDVPEELGKSLLEQETNWVAATARPAKPAKAEGDN